MHIVILMQSTTGNTRLVVRFAAEHLRRQGHSCEVINIIKHPEPPDLTGADLVGVACPTMYFRPTFTMERYVARLANAVSPGKPAFLFNTCGGMPGAHFAILAELMAYKGYVTLGAHWVLAPSNWPPHVKMLQSLAWSEPLATLASWTPRSLRPLWAVFWEKTGLPDGQDRDELVAFLDDMVHRAREGRLEDAPSPQKLHVPLPTTGFVGRIIPREMPDKVLKPHIDSSRCTRCGTCVTVCSERIITRVADDAVPRIGHGCSGCYACFNHCPDGAISDALTQPGRGQYKRPPRQMRELFADS